MFLRDLIGAIESHKHIRELVLVTVEWILKLIYINNFKQKGKQTEWILQNNIDTVMELFISVMNLAPK